MEGQFGSINGEMGTQPSTIRPTAGAEGDVAVSLDTQLATTNQNDSEATESIQNKDTERSENQEPAQDANSTREEDKRTSKEEKLTPEEIEEGFDKIWKSLDADSEKKKIFEQYRAELFGEHDESDKRNNKLVETSAELLRFIKLILTLLYIYITNPKDLYTGEDLPLSETPPEGDEGRDLPGNMTGSYDSWRKTREGVQKIKQPLPFADFMNLVLKINAENPVKKYKLKKEETKHESLLKRLIKQKLIKDAAKSTGRKIIPPRPRSG